jgi:hypothetical protein
MQQFAPFDVALETFYRVGGAYPTTIRAPDGLVQVYRHAFPEGPTLLRYANVPVELADQNHLSVRGKSVTGSQIEVSADAVLTTVHD